MRLKKNEITTFINYNKNPVRGIGLGYTYVPIDNLYRRKITKSDVKITLWNMRIGKSIEPNNIPIEVSKCIRERGFV